MALTQKTETPPTTVLRVVLAALFVSSIVHYTDNTIRYDAYTQDYAGPITRPVIVVAWVLFTLLGLMGYISYRQGRWAASGWCIAAYSVSGLISPLHYTTVSPSSYDPLQHTFIVTDLLAGLAAMGFALWLFSTRVRPTR